jgi:hypothetical protein
MKRIASLTADPPTVNLTDRPCSLFIDPKTGFIFVDEGEGDGRMNGAVFSPKNAPSFAVRPSSGSDQQLVLDYCGTSYLIGATTDGPGLRTWAESANAVLRQGAASGGLVVPANGRVMAVGERASEPLAPGT